MKQSVFLVTENAPVAPGVYRMRLSGDVGGFTRPGQFANLKLGGLFLRRPISLCDMDSGSFTIVYRVVGDGTRRMAEVKTGDSYDILTGLGNGYDTGISGASPLLIGGGVGIPPLYYLAKCLLAEGKSPAVLLGFSTANDIFLEGEFAALGIPVQVYTADGSSGQPGMVTDGMAHMDYTCFYACGPMPMFRAVEHVARTTGQYSFEEKMGCGFGACMGCTCKTKYGDKRICKDGPVLTREEVVW